MSAAPPQTFKDKALTLKRGSAVLLLVFALPSS